MFEEAFNFKTMEQLGDADWNPKDLLPSDERWPPLGAAMDDDIQPCNSETRRGYVDQRLTKTLAYLLILLGGMMHICIDDQVDSIEREWLPRPS